MSEPVYISTPIYYVNDVPHIGHAYTSITCDALARWYRQCGREVRFITGTDEHGLKIQRSAEAAGRTPLEQADFTSARFRAAWELLDIQFDDFIRTTEPRHIDAVQKMMQRIYDNGFIYRDTYAGWYCVSCEAYYDEEQLIPVEGQPGGNCPDHRKPAEWFEEDNYFFKLSEFEKPLLDWYEANPDCVGPEGKRNEALGIIKQGLRDISVTRTSIDWGVPVPWDDRHVFYVWYDALINYATSVGYGTDTERFAHWWPSVHHVIGKDILRFHCVYWPAMLMAAGELPPHRISVHGHLLIGGEKMSKSLFNQIAPKDLIEGDLERGYAAFGVDGYRYHFLRDQSFGPDGDFSYEGMVVRYNTDLANTLGNLLSRVAKVVSKKCDGIGPAPDGNSPLRPLAETALAESIEAWDALQPSKALDATMRLVRDTNEYLAQHEPWKMEPGPEVDRVLGDALESLRIAAILLSPALVNASQQIWERIGLSGTPTDEPTTEFATWGQYPGGLDVTVGDPIFPRIS